MYFLVIFVVFLNLNEELIIGVSVLNQKTINKSVSIDGIGLHSGKNVTMTVKPAQPNSGILFKRIDLKKNNLVFPNLNFSTPIPAHVLVILMVLKFLQLSI